MKAMYIYTHHILCEKHGKQLRELLAQRGVKNPRKAVYRQLMPDEVRCWCCLREIDARVFLAEEALHPPGSL